MKRYPTLLALTVATTLAAGTAWAGNRAMVEKRIEELDRLNRSVVRQVTDLPREGRVNVRARVRPEGTVDILESEILPAPDRTPKTPADRTEAPPLRNAIQRFHPDRAQVAPYRDANSHGRYPSFREALVAAFGASRRSP